jgi:uncharacterized protein
MLPIFFGEESHRLFGILHSRPAGSPARRGVLLCTGFGREAVQLRRLNRVLAERLAREGCDVLRFDYFGSGDSAGDDVDADLAVWSRDVIAAHHELLRRSGNSQVTWLAFRAGSAVCEGAAKDMPASLRKLVLVDPITDGREYLDRMRTQLYRYLGLNHLPPSTDFQQNPSFVMDEGLGFAMSQRLCEQLRELRFVAPTTPIATTVLCDPQLPNGQRIKAACVHAGPHVRLVEVAHGPDWTGQATPPALLKRLAEEAGSAT